MYMALSASMCLTHSLHQSIFRASIHPSIHPAIHYNDETTHHDCTNNAITITIAMLIFVTVALIRYKYYPRASSLIHTAQFGAGM